MLLSIRQGMNDHDTFKRYKRSGVLHSMRDTLAKHPEWSKDEHTLKTPGTHTGKHSSKVKHFVHQLLKERSGEVVPLQTTREAAKNSLLRKGK